MCALLGRVSSLRPRTDSTHLVRRLSDPGLFVLAACGRKYILDNRGGDVTGFCVCIEKSLFALSSFQFCPLSQVKYLSNISECESSVLESCEGCSSRTPFLMECAVLLMSKNMCVCEGRCVVSLSADHRWVLAGGFQKRGNSGLEE